MHEVLYLRGSCGRDSAKEGEREGGKKGEHKHGGGYHFVIHTDSSIKQ